jgi:hypothetical protein
MESYPRGVDLCLLASSETVDPRLLPFPYHLIITYKALITQISRCKLLRVVYLTA